MTHDERSLLMAVASVIIGSHHVVSPQLNDAIMSVYRRVLETMDDEIAIPERE